MAWVREILAFSIACASCRALSDACAAPNASIDDAASSIPALTEPVFICLSPSIALTQTATLACGRGSWEACRTTPLSVKPYAAGPDRPDAAQQTRLRVQSRAGWRT